MTVVVQYYLAPGARLIWSAPTRKSEFIQLEPLIRIDEINAQTDADFSMGKIIVVRLMRRPDGRLEFEHDPAVPRTRIAYGFWLGDAYYVGGDFDLWCEIHQEPVNYRVLDYQIDGRGVHLIERLIRWPMEEPDGDETG